MKKRLYAALALLMAAALALALPMTAAAEPATTVAAAPLRVLAIGNSYSQDAMNYLYKVFQAESDRDVVLGYLYYGGCSLEQHLQFAQSGSKSYTYYKNNSGYWQSWGSRAMTYGLQDEAWDVITLQQVSTDSGAPDSYAPLDELIAFVRQNAGNQDAKLYWHMTWAWQNGYENNPAFITRYNNSQAYMYERITSAVQEKILPRQDLTGVIPSGTAVQNARSSYLGDNLNRDGTHLNELGKVIAAYTWYCTLTGSTVDDLRFRENFGQAMSASDALVIAEAVRGAVKQPFAVTPSAYPDRIPLYTVTVDGKQRHGGGAAGTTVPISATEGRYRTFRRWEVVSGGVTLDDPTAKETAFIMPAGDVEIRGVYEEKPWNRPTGDTGLRIGFGQEDITPSQSAPLAGYGNTTARMSQGTLRPEDRLTLTAITLSDGERTSVLCTVDVIYAATGWMRLAREEVSRRTGVPTENISISATHTHSGPDAGDANPQFNQALTPDSWYFPEFVDAMTQAVSQSLEDLAPVTAARSSTVRVQGLNWIRHWMYHNGMMGGVNTSVTGSAYAGLPRETDQDMQIVRFFRAGEKKDVVLVNWQSHATVASTSSTDYGKAGRPYLSADFPGYMRRYVEEQDGHCRAAYFQGALGNVICLTTMQSVKNRWQPPQEADEIGRRLGELALDAMEHMSDIPVGKVQSLRQQHVAFDRDYAGTTREIEQDVVTLGGGMAFVTAGYEMFDSNGMEVKEASPFPVTFVCGCSQSNEYMPDWQVHHYYLFNGVDNYVAYEARTSQCNVVSGTGEDLANGLIAMLSKLYRSR